MGIDDAKSVGATAMFGEKYGDEVRVITVGDFSMELCGEPMWTAPATSACSASSEGGVVAGVRRIEAQTGLGAMRVIREEAAALGHATTALRVRPDEVAGAVQKLQDDAKAPGANSTRSGKPPCRGAETCSAGRGMSAASRSSQPRATM